MAAFIKRASSLRFAVLPVISMLCVGNAGAAEPTPSDACLYFAQDLSLYGVEKAKSVEYTDVTLPDFKQISLTLDRYAVLISSEEIIREFGIRSANGDLEVRGKISALLICEVDIVDRRVLRLSVIQGPSAGTSIVLETGKRTIERPDPAVMQIGLQVHRGKY